MEPVIIIPILELLLLIVKSLEPKMPHNKYLTLLKLIMDDLLGDQTLLSRHVSGLETEALALWWKV